MSLELKEEYLVELAGLKASHKAVKKYIKCVVETFTVCVFSLEDTGESVKVKEVLIENGLDFFEVVLSSKSVLCSIFVEVLELRTRSSSIQKTNVFVNSYHITDYNKLVKFIRVGRIYDLLDGDCRDYDYDLIVIGAGPGGIEAALEASSITGTSVAIFDFVKKSERGCRWGVGGTCLNVGCIPREMFCLAALMKEAVQGCHKFGWKVDDNERPSADFEWKTLVSAVHSYTISKNKELTEMFQTRGITYYNKFVTFIDKHTIKATDNLYSNCVGKHYTAQNFIIATGLIPIVPKIPGSKHIITTRDFFHIRDNPRKVLIIGSSFTAFEYAGFLAVLNIVVTVCSEIDPLSSLDRACLNRILQHLKCLGVKFYCHYKVESLVKLDEEDIVSYEYLVTMKKLESFYSSDYCNDNLPSVVIEEFSVVFAAVGRVSTAKQLNIERLGVQLNNQEGSRRILVDSMNHTSCRTIYAVGDVADLPYPFPTSYTIVKKMGSSVVRNLFFGTQFSVDRRCLPVVVHTPIQYACVGLSEEAAVEKFGPDSIDVYDNELYPIEWQIARKMVGTPCYAKVICYTDYDNKVVGLHYVGPNASEVISSFGLAVKMGCKMKDLDSMVGLTTSHAQLFAELKLRL